MSKLNEIQKIMLTLILFLVVLIAVTTIIYAIDYRNKDLTRDINAGLVRGCIQTYVEPVFDGDDIYLYIVVGHLDMMHILGLTKDVYDIMDKDLRSAIDSRKTGFYVDFDTVMTKNERANQGHVRISTVNEYNLYGTVPPPLY